MSLFSRRNEVSTNDRMQVIGGLEEGSGERIGKPLVAGKIHQNNKKMLFSYSHITLSL